MCLEIIGVYGREILDSRGNPTVEARIIVKNAETGKQFEGCAAVPSGASTGKYEAVELRDGEKRYLGRGVERAVGNIHEKIAPVLLGQDAFNQARIDSLLVITDGTENKENLGANATLAVSMAVARAASGALELPLYRYLGGINGRELPMPMMNILNGGRHASNTVDFQEFMIVPVGAECFSTGLRICTEIYHNLKKLLESRGLSTGVGDEGGFAPNLADGKEALRLIIEAIRYCGYKPGKDVGIALDAAASELYDKECGLYRFPGESALKGRKITRTTSEMIGYYEELIKEFPIISIEDGLDEEDWEGWQLMTKHLGNQVRLVGDDLFVTNEKRLQKGISQQAGNAILIKVNQIGTLTEALNAVTLAKKHGFSTIISHRSGETEDTIIADLAVALNAGWIKAGAPCRSERVAKYNRLLRIEQEINVIK